MTVKQLPPRAARGAGGVKGQHIRHRALRRRSLEKTSEKECFAAVPLLLRASFDSGSVVDACVSFERFSP